MYRLIYSTSATKDLRKLPKQFVKQIIKRIEKLPGNPRQSGATKLRGYRDIYRVRQGSCRIIYKINDEELLILIVEVGHRREVYRHY